MLYRQIVFSALALGVHALWPLPTSVQTGSTPLRLADGFSIDVSAVANAPDDLGDAVTRAQQYLGTDNLARLVPDRGASDASAVEGAAELTSLALTLADGATVNSISAEAVKAIGARDDSYTLAVPTSGAATITANTTLGLLRGLTTFGQLWYAVENTTYTLEAPITIEDAPAFPYRGFMLDTARNFFPVADIERTLDAMSWAKMNTFHWHVVDSQSFPLTVPGFEELAQKGAYSAAKVYSTDDVAHIVAYAAARGIDVLAEIDTPGHTAVLATSHPEHVACPQAAPWADFANEPPAGQLRLATPATQNFTKELLTAAAKMFGSTLFSTGGDEINANCYTQDAETQAALQAAGQTLEEALSAFTVNNHEALAAEGKTPVVWEEMVLDHNVTLSNETVVMVWISSANAAAVAEKGFRLVHGPSDYFYLDCGAGEWIGGTPDSTSWCDPFKSWQHAYTFDPYANITDAQKPLVLGGQQLLWTEQSAPANLDSIVWPRAAASAELFWSGAGGNLTSALPRLHDLAYRMNARGVNAIALQPEWCALRPNACDVTA